MDIFDTKKVILEALKESHEHCVEQNGLNYCKNCGLDFRNIINLIENNLENEEDPIKEELKKRQQRGEIEGWLELNTNQEQVAEKQEDMWVYITKEILPRGALREIVGPNGNFKISKIEARDEDYNELEVSGRKSYTLNDVLRKEQKKYGHLIYNKEDKKRLEVKLNKLHEDKPTTIYLIKKILI